MSPNSNYCCNVLIVDDNESVCKSLEMIVHNIGHKACSALTGHSAVNKIKNHIFDIAFVDCDLPDLDSNALIDKIKRKDENPDIFMIMPERTMYKTELTIREDISGVIKKPIVMEEILLVVETTATKRMLLKENQKLREQIHEFKLQLEISKLAISHDAINDIQFLLGQLELISRDQRSLDKHYVELCSAVTGRVALLLNMFNDHMHDTFLNFLEKIKDLAETYMRVFSELRIDLIIKEFNDFELPSNFKMLTFVFNNLLSNIIKHAGENAQVEIIINKPRNRLHITIKDNGPGVAAQIRDRLFEYGASTSGGGKGLYLSRKVVEHLGGTIELATAENGACFKISLPVVAQE